MTQRLAKLLAERESHEFGNKAINCEFSFDRAGGWTIICWTHGLGWIAIRNLSQLGFAGFSGIMNVGITAALDFYGFPFPIYLG